MATRRSSRALCVSGMGRAEVRSMRLLITGQSMASFARRSGREVYTTPFKALECKVSAVHGGQRRTAAAETLQDRLLDARSVESTQGQQLGRVTVFDEL